MDIAKKQLTSLIRLVTKQYYCDSINMYKYDAHDMWHLMNFQLGQSSLSITKNSCK